MGPTDGPHWWAIIDGFGFKNYESQFRWEFLLFCQHKIDQYCINSIEWPLVRCQSSQSWMFVFVRICSFLKDVRVFSHTNKNTPPESFHSSHSINRPFLLKQEARRDIFKKVLEKYQLKLLNDECSNASWILDIVYPDFFANSSYKNLYSILRRVAKII